MRRRKFIKTLALSIGASAFSLGMIRGPKKKVEIAVSNINGIAIAPGDAFLMTDQVDPCDNGIYVYNGTAKARVIRST